MAHDVFISHSKHDKVVADAVRTGLEASGIRCWIAPRDIQPGMDFAEGIMLGLDACTVMVLIFSAHANVSRYVLREVTEAVERDMIIIPFRIEDTLPSRSMKFYLNTPHWLDALDEPLEKHILKLRETLAKLLPNISDPPFQIVENIDAIRIAAILPSTDTYNIGVIQRADVNRKLNADPLTEMKVNLKDGAAMRWVPSGEFLMGSLDRDEAAYADEKPQHLVYLDGYYIYQYAVTVAQYRKFCTATTRDMPDVPSWGWQETHPMVNVTWEDARVYAEWAGAALPTEAEWEKAARGTEGFIYPWGTAWDPAKCSNSVGDNNLGKTSPVGSFPSGASPYGCLDMSGNVYEWCADWYGEDYYRHSPDHNPTGPETGDTRVLSGGSWGLVDPEFFRAAFRNRGSPLIGVDFGGFRCVVRSPGL